MASIIPESLIQDLDQLDVIPDQPRSNPRKSKKGRISLKQTPRLHPPPKEIVKELAIADPPVRSTSEVRQNQTNHEHEEECSGEKPAGRKDAQAVHQELQERLSQLPPLPEVVNTRSDMETLVQFVEQEQSIYDKIFSQVIKQVASHTTERGVVLQEVRDGYSRLFRKVPSTVRNVYNQAVAQRVILKRLLEDLLLTKETIGRLMLQAEEIRKPKDPSFVKIEKHVLTYYVDQRVIRQPTTEQELRNLYKLQRERIEEQLQTSYATRQRWIQVAQKLTFTLAQKHGWTDHLERMMKAAELRNRWATQFTIIIRNVAEQQWKQVQARFEQWRNVFRKLTSFCALHEEKRIQKLSSMLVALRTTLKRAFPTQDGHTTNNDSHAVARDSDSDDNPHLTILNTNDKQLIINQLASWTNELKYITAPKQSILDKQAVFNDDKRILEGHWTHLQEIANALLARCQPWSDDNSYKRIEAQIQMIGNKLISWTQKAWDRLAGDATVMSSLKDLFLSMEDKQSMLLDVDLNEALSSEDSKVLQTSMTQWTKNLGIAMTSLQQVAFHENIDDTLGKVDELVLQIRRQIHLDVNNREEEAGKIYDSMIEWTIDLVHCSVSECSPSMRESIDIQYTRIVEDLNSGTESILRLTLDLATLRSLDDQDLSKLLKIEKDTWITASRDLLNACHEVWSNESPALPQRPQTSHVQETLSVPMELMRPIQLDFKLGQEEDHHVRNTNEILFRIKTETVKQALQRERELLAAQNK